MKSITWVCEHTGAQAQQLHRWENAGHIKSERSLTSGHRMYDDATIERITVFVRAIEAGSSVADAALHTTEELERMYPVKEDTVKPENPVMVAAARAGNAGIVAHEIKKSCPSAWLALVELNNQKLLRELFQA